ncbi:MAG TPA: serine/threonine dehydratase [Rhizomicrobium sp.]|nr:serine/threonine dehydratase [Rhizomicrobium sp.]
MPKSVDRAAIAANYASIRPHIRRTPVLAWDEGVTLKLEQTQHSGSFKVRGAFTNLLARKIPAAGVAAASGGNHGAAVAYAAMKLGVRAKIFVPEISSPAKIARIRDYGAALAVGGAAYAEALAACEAYIAGTGALPLHAFDQAETMIGQGSVALELEEQVEGLDTILAAVGGGGLIGGIAAWCAGGIKVVGVEPQASPTLEHALKAGRPVEAPVGGIAADSLAPRQVGALVFPIAREFVDRVVLVGDDDIRAAQKALWSGARQVAEPGGATAFAALNSGRYKPARGERVGIVVSGANTTAVDFDR